MKLVKNAAKVLAVGFAFFIIVRPLSIPKLPPVHVMASAEIVQK